ncbi:sugar phosphate isomerase/epimerase family protein [Sphingobium lactosutens]|uniref:sugar phosphate isomerase/epimerase family protein n=1 Tax=Sphingobium lactosutens TaxID=522773 RepID=UPI0015BD310F|nr:TIM barrel protein [Sphingobium lactosutens]
MNSAARELSFHHLSAQETDPVGLIEAAAHAGFENICTFFQDTTDESVSFPLVSRQNAAAVKAALRSTGVKIYNAEIFFLTPDTPVESFIPALELAAELGARRATALIADEDFGRSTENFHRFCEITARLNISAGLEFMTFTSIKTLSQAMQIIDAAAHANGSLALDMLHMIRNGSGAVDLARLPAGAIGYVQLCDGPLSMDPDRAFEEAVFNRTAPGQGEFPLLDALDHIPIDRCLSLEVPMDRLRGQGMNIRARARLLYDSARSVLRQHDERRQSSLRETATQ